MSDTVKIILALLFIGAALLLVLRLAGDSPGGNFATERIIFVCDDGDYEICVVDADGQNFQQLTRNNSRDFRISANSHGEIAFVCARERATTNSQMELCYMDLNSGTFVRLSDLRYPVNFSEYPLITEDGRIIYICFDPDDIVEICSVRIDGSDGRLLTNNTYVEFALAAHNNSEIAFICVDEAAASFFETEICGMSNTGRNMRRITNNELLERGVQINNRGTILTNCYEAVLKNLGLCTTTTSSGTLNISSYSAVGDAYSMNGAGQVAMQCADTLDAEICAMHVNGTGFRLLTRNSTDDKKPTISDDGLIAYHCELRICLINYDGSGFREITTASQPSAVADERIAIY